MITCNKRIPILFLFFISLKLSAQLLIPVSHENWSLIYVDSEEKSLGRYATNAFDDDINTIWHTEWVASDPVYPHEMQIDLGDVYMLTGLRYLPRQDGGPNGTIIEYDFYTSLDGSNWVKVISKGTWERNTSEKETLFSRIEGRYIRFVGLKEINGNPWASCAELNVLHVFTGVAFEADKKQVSKGETVYFTDLSGNSPTAWEWIFEGATPAVSHEQNPSVIYNDFGRFTVTLITSSETGKDTLTKPGYILVDYCIPEVISNDIYIDTVRFGNIMNATGPDQGVADYTHLSTEVYRGAFYQIYVHYNNPWNAIDTSACWIDWNKNGAFEDSEFTLLSGHHSVNGVVKVPEDAVLDTVRMRILARYWRWPPDACEDVENGEIEDYSIVIMPLSSGIPLADFEADRMTICAGESVRFTDLSLNTPNKWLWNFEGGEPDSAVFQTQIVRYPVAGSYNVSLFVSQPSGSDTTIEEAYITVYGDTSISRYGGILTANASDATYQWINCADNSKISGATGQTYEPAENGIYAVKIFQNGCEAVSSCHVVNNVAVSGLSGNQSFRIYPNPNKGSFKLELPAESVCDIQVFNSTGTLIYSNPVAVNSEEIHIGIKGIYFVKIKSGKKIRIKKVAVE